MIPEIKLVVIVPFYNDFKALQRLLMHLSSIGMSSILCDGRFHNFQKINDSDLSTDGSRFLVQGYKDTTLVNRGPCYVYEKLNVLFHEAAKQDYSHCILLGSDEDIEGDIELLKKELDQFPENEPLLIGVPFDEKSPKLDKPPRFIERIVQMPGLIRAKGTHNTFFSAADQAKGIVTPMKSHSTVISGITIHHDNSIRDKKRNELMKDYQTYIKETKF